MKTSIRLMCWILVGVVFCTVSLGGCGGSDNMASVNSQGGSISDYIGTIISGDTSGGRGDGWYDLGFDMFAGSWEVYDIYGRVNPDVALDYQALAISRFKLIPHPAASGGNLEITTLDGRPIGQITLTFWNTERNISLTDVVFLSGGTYESTNRTAFYRKDNGNNDYYELEGAVDSYGNLSLPLKHMFFRHYNGTGEENTYAIQTLLQKIPDNTVEDITLVDGNWKIVSASLQMRNDPGPYPMATDTEYGAEPKVRLLPMSGYLLWTDDLYTSSPSYNYTSLYVPFSWTSIGKYVVTTMPLLDPTTGEYSMITPMIMETPRTDSNGKPLNFQRIEGFGLLPWERIKISRYTYTDAGELDDIVEAMLERIR